MSPAGSATSPTARVRAHVEGDPEAVRALVGVVPHRSDPVPSCAGVEVTDAAVEGLASFEVR